MRFDFVLSEGLAFDSVLSERLAVGLHEQEKISKEMSDFFVEANKREDNLEFIMEEHRRLLKK